MSWAHTEGNSGENKQSFYESLPQEIKPIVSPRARWKDHDHKDMRKIGLKEAEVQRKAEDAKGRER